MASKEIPGVRSNVFIRQDSSSTSLSLGFDPYQDGLNLQFVEPLEDRYKCVTCSFVLSNPYQTGCGHRFCEKCITNLTESKPIGTCPIDREGINPSLVFKDNCCKREVWNLMVYCKNTPDCGVTVSFGRLGDHVKKCQFETVACDNGCDATLRRKDLIDHLHTVCEYREEACQYCKVTLVFKNIKEHEVVTCPKYPINCTNNCGESCIRSELDTHLSICPESEVECSYKKYGCHTREKRRKIVEHEHSCLNEHLLLVVRNNNKLEEQVFGEATLEYYTKKDIVKLESAQQRFPRMLPGLERLFYREKFATLYVTSLECRRMRGDLKKFILDLQKTLCDRNHIISQLEEQIDKLDSKVAQLSELISKNDDEVVRTQKILAGHADKIITIEQHSQQFCRRLDQERNNEVAALKEVIHVLKEKVECAENNIASLVSFEPSLKQHELLLSAHKKLLEETNERFRVLEATGYNGKLIWKICNYRRRKQEAAEGTAVSLFSQPFYTSRCGYRLCARAYLNGDGAGKGTHLSLFFVVMKGEFDSLLMWPFKQKVTLTLLDQSPKKHHIVDHFKADANSTSFKRPISEMNIASGSPRFVSHGVLEGGKTGTFIKDDTLFIKVSVDLTDLEDQ